MEKYKTVDDYLAGLSDDNKPQVQLLRRYILDASLKLVEHIKWNAASYAKDGVDRITFNTMNKDGRVKLVFHMGALRKEDKNGQPVLRDVPLIEWVSDIRGYMTFDRLQDILTNEKDIKQTIRQWLEIA